jgi:hypothetical protein
MMLPYVAWMQFGKLCTTRASGSERVHLPQTPERMSGLSFTVMFSFITH